MVVKKTAPEVGTSAGSCRKLLPLYLYTALYMVCCIGPRVSKFFGTSGCIPCIPGEGTRPGVAGDEDCVTVGSGSFSL